MKGTASQKSQGSATDRSFQEYVAVVIRGKWIVLGVFGVVFLAVLIFTFLSQPIYTATCQVLMNKAEMKTSVFLDAMRPDRLENVVQNELAVLNSRALTDTVAERLIRRQFVDDAKTIPISIIRLPDEGGRTGAFAPVQLISGKLSNAVDFDPVRDSDLIRISAQSKNPQEAALLANLFAEAYRDRNIYMSRTKSRSFREFLEDQAREKRKVLDETEASLQAYMERQGIVSLDDESKKVITQLADLEASRDATDISLRQLRNTLEQYQEQLPQQETNVARLMSEANDPYIRLLQEQIAKLEVEKDVTVAQNPSNVGREVLNEKVREIDARIAALRQKLQGKTDEFLQSLTPSQGGSSQDATSYLKSIKQKIIETQIEVQALESKKKALDDVIRQYEGQFGRIPSKSVALARLQRTRLANEKLYLMVEEKYNEANITEKSNIGYVEIIEPALPPYKPSSPKVLVNIAIGIILGLGLGLVVAFVREWVDVRIYSPEDLKRRGFHLLTSIKDIEREVARLKAKNIPIAQGGGGHDRRLITLSLPFSSIAESYRQLRTNLQFARHGEPVRVILLTSPNPGEGKSTTAANLAVSFAQTGKKVLLVDADLRRPMADQIFKIKKDPGISDLLAGKALFDSIIRVSKIENLDVVTCGTIQQNPAEMLGSQKMRDFIAQAKQHYEIVILDSSPILAVTDPAVASTLTDGAIVVVSAGTTRMSDLEQSREILDAVGGNIIGVILNRFDLQRAYGISYRRGSSTGYGYSSVYSSSGGRHEAQAPPTRNPV